MSKTRLRAAKKIETPKQQWEALTAPQQRTLLCVGDDEDHLVGTSYHVIQALIDWWCIRVVPKGYVLTVNGRAARDYGRSLTP